MRRLLALVLASLAASTAAQDCSITSQNTTVYRTLQDWYYWYRFLPEASPTTFADPEALLDTVRYRPLDNTFSYISTAAASQAFYGESQYLGFGFSMKFTVGYELRVTDVFPPPPPPSGLRPRQRNPHHQRQVGAEDLRGWRVEHHLGRRRGRLLGGSGLQERRGPDEVRTDRQARGDDSTVPLATVLEAGGKKTGYIVFKNFVEPSYAALDAAFAQLRDAGATELVLDLRYNGGGLIAVAQYLGGLIGGDRTSGEVFAQYVHNDKRSDRNNAIRFPRPAGAFPLNRLIVITTRSSASASELIINALKPFIPVIVVGDNSYGKPVGQYGFRVCEKMLWPVSFNVQNARNQGDYFDGFAPDCRAADDIGHALGDPREASLATALNFLATGACPVAATGRTALELDRPGPAVGAHRENGWQALRVAY
jgi:carboxyl-terminal processing protease